MGHADDLPKDETQNNYLIGFSCGKNEKHQNNAASTSSDNLLLQYRANVS